MFKNALKIFLLCFAALCNIIFSGVGFGFLLSLIGVPFYVGIPLFYAITIFLMVIGITFLSKKEGKNGGK